MIVLLFSSLVKKNASKKKLLDRSTIASIRRVKTAYLYNTKKSITISVVTTLPNKRQSTKSKIVGSVYTYLLFTTHNSISWDSKISVSSILSQQRTHTCWHNEIPTLQQNENKIHFFSYSLFKMSTKIIFKSMKHQNIVLKFN